MKAQEEMVRVRVRVRDLSTVVAYSYVASGTCK